MKDSILRQVQIFASIMVFIAFLGARYVHPNFIYLTLLVGTGLAIAGCTGVCPAALIFQKMPWNKNSTKSCSTDKSCCL